MLIIGCDYHSSFQQIAFVDTETGELREGDWITRMVQARTRIMNQLQAVVPTRACCAGKKLWRERGRQQLKRSRWLRGPAGFGRGEQPYTENPVGWSKRSLSETPCRSQTLLPTPRGAFLSGL